MTKHKYKDRYKVVELTPSQQLSKIEEYIAIVLLVILAAWIVFILH